MADGRTQRDPNQGLVYTLLSPLALAAVLVWLLEGRSLQVVGSLFLLYSTLLCGLIPRDLAAAWHPSARWLGPLAAGAVLAFVGWRGGLLPGLVLMISVASLLRLGYLRQYHLQQGDERTAELLRRGLLISMWSHASVLVALVNPYM